MKIYQHNQYDTLKSCLICYPVYFDIVNKSNEYYKKIDYELLFSQYNNFLNNLTENNVKLNFLDLCKNGSSQLFTQDIGFVIDDVFFISNMKKQERCIESPYLIEFIKKNNLKYYKMKNSIEGGDLIHYDDVLFIGISTRTTIDAAHELQFVLNEMRKDIEVIPIYFDNTMIHLDCVFNTLEKGAAVISPYVYDKNIIKKYIPKLYEISKTDSDNLGTNFVYLGQKKLFSSNKNVTQMLNYEDYDVTYIDYGEIVKNEGSLGCSILYLLRE